MTVAFRFEIVAGALGIKEEANIIVTPNWGFFGFVLAAICSLIITHIILHKHRSVNERDIKESDVELNLSAKNPYLTYLVIGLVGLAVILLLVGSFIKSFAFSF